MMRHTPLLFLLLGCSGSDKGSDENSMLEACESAYSAYETCMSTMGILDTGDTTSDCDDISETDTASAEAIEMWECLAAAYTNADCSSKKNFQDLLSSVAECQGMDSMFDSGR